MANKQKGSNAERELLKKFTENSYRAARVAGSGVNDDSPCDLIAGKKGKKFAIECKSSKDRNIYIKKEQIEDFMLFAEMMGLDPVLAARFNREGWFFLHPRHLKDSGKNFVLNLDNAKENGKRFSQFFE
ncbi:MAG: Holliday junction resolvase Hjc [Nanoarchaeota archaeon]